METKVGHAPYLLMSLNHSCDAFFWIGFASFDIFPDCFHIEGYRNGEFMIRILEISIIILVRNLILVVKS